jgi:site-specific recombinase XerD
MGAYSVRSASAAKESFWPGLPRVPQTMIQTFSEEQLQALVHAPDTRRWKGIRDRALVLVLLGTLARVSEIVGLNAEDVDLDGRTSGSWARAASSGSCSLGRRRGRRCRDTGR